MGSFTTGVPNLVNTGPVFDLLVAVPASVADLQSKSGESSPDPIQIRALIDTGATATVLREGLAVRLGLHPVGVTAVHTASATNVMCAQFSVLLAFPNNVSGEVIATEMPLENQPIDCLVGRDVLAIGVFVYIGYMNQFSFSI